MKPTFITVPDETHRLVVEFSTTGEPISKARARFTNYGSKTRAYTPQKTLDGEAAISAAYLKAARRRGTNPEAAYAVHVHFYNGTRQRRDVDNMVKLVLDGLNGIAWVDDNQVLEIVARKSFVSKSEARTVVRVYDIGEMGFPKKACLNCGTEFRTYASWESNPNGKKYCSRECANKRIRDLKERECAHCGDVFTAEKSTSTTKFCSKECSYESRRTTTDCAVCGKAFSIQNCHVKDRNYCSKECVRENDRVIHKERRSKYFPGTCMICGSGTTRKEYKRCNPCKLNGATGAPSTESPAPSSKSECSDPDCTEIARTKGMCGKHYMRTRRAADRD